MGIGEAVSDMLTVKVSAGNICLQYQQTAVLQ